MNPTTNLQDLQELKSRLLQRVGTVEPHATKCLEGTRTSILADIDIKTHDRDGANIIHIYGAPGSGKSSISLTAKSRLHRQRRLITYFRFDRNDAATTTPTSLWCHVAYDLARLFPSVLSYLLEQLRDNEVELDSSMDIFTSFVENALSNITSPVDRPLVIIIDALDECGGGLAGRPSSDRRMLLQTLRRWSMLPKHFKLLVTSRPEGDIVRALSSISTPIDIPSGHLITENPQAKVSIETSNDIQTFLEERFTTTRQIFPSLPADWPGPPIISVMVQRAAGVFMWATTAANFIEEGIDPRGRLQEIIDDASDSSPMKPLYSLYSIVLEMGFGKVPSRGLEAEILQSVLGTMVIAKRPLDDLEYTKLPTAKPITEDMLGGIRERLRSVISPGSLRFVHKSFDDFLLSEECPSKYRINPHESHYLMTKLCLTTMTEGLHFNICGLETSCFRNADVPNITSKIANSISPLLSYSCLFFADHLGLTLFDEYLMHEVREMVLDKLLFWFEAMSLLKEITRVSPSLLLILKWLHISPNDEFKDFLHDARRFIGSFGVPISQSAPHIYISALPFAPENSVVAKHFLPHFPSILAFSTGKSASWSSCIFTSEHHTTNVHSVAFSVDGEYFVSAAFDKDICVFDSETGNLISGPFECDDWILSVCFDSNGHRVGATFKNGKVICWDVETGDKHLVIDTSHNYKLTDRFCCHISGSQTIISAGKTIALWNGETGRCEQDYDWMDEDYEGRVLTSISPDGCYVARVAGQFETTIMIWRVMSRSKIQGPVNPHSRVEHPQRISALSFSVDSKFAVSGSQDGTVLIWDASTGDIVGSPLNTGTDWVLGVAYSPNNHLLASTHDTVTIWNPSTQELLGRLESETSPIRDMALSRDGQRLLTGSWDGTVRTWDWGRKGVELGANVNQTHTSRVWNIAFSRCGKKLASLDNSSIYLWGASAGKFLFKCDTEAEYRALIFSPDGNQVVAYRNNSGSIRVWNANTGALISQLNLRHDNELSTWIDHVAFRSTDGVLVLCSNNGVVRIWSILDGIPQIIAKLPNVVALSPDGLTAIVSDDKGRPCYVWSTTTHQPLPLVIVDGEHISGFKVSYSPSGRLFANWEPYRGKSTVWVSDMWTGGLAARFSTTGRICSLAFSPDDRHIAIAYATPSSRGKISIFNAHTGQLTSGPWSGHNGDTFALAFSPDGKFLASSSEDRQVRIWNVAHMLKNPQLSLGNPGVGAHMEDGWVKDAGGRLLYWVSKDQRTRLVWPHCVPLGESETMIELDLSRFKYGESWTKCFSGRDVVKEQTSGL